MQFRFNIFAAAVAAIAMLMAAVSARAEGFVLSGPVAHENLSVYFVHGSGGGAAAPLTLEQAQARGAIQIHETATHPVMVENLSGQSVFIQLGDLITGGMQDQVAGISLVLPPHSGMTPLVTFCVDPFRSSARDGDDPKLFSAIGALIPSRLAKLSILSGAGGGAAFGKIREQAVWWSIDSLRASLSQRIGETLETPRVVRWDPQKDGRAHVLLDARRAGWITSLPLALESQSLLRAQDLLIDAFRGAGAGAGDDVIGAVFAINGNIVGADIYQSHALFGAMWPKLLRAFVTESLAAESVAAVPPSREDVTAFLTAAGQDQSRQRSFGRDGRLTDGDAVIALETAARGGEWVHRSYVAKLDPAAVPAAPETLLVGMLETGQVEGRSIATLHDRDNLVLRKDAESGTWSVTVPAAATDTRLFEQMQRDNAGGFLGSLFQAVVSLLLLVFLGRVFWLELMRPAIRASVAAMRGGASAVRASGVPAACTAGAVIARKGRASGQIVAQAVAEVLAATRDLAQGSWRALVAASMFARGAMQWSGRSLRGMHASLRAHAATTARPRAFAMVAHMPSPQTVPLS